MQQSVAQWAGFSLTLFIFLVGQIGSIVYGFVRLERRLGSIEARLGDRDGGMVAQVHDHEERIRSLERLVLPAERQGLK